MRNRETTRNVRNDCYRNVTFWNHEKMFGQLPPPFFFFFWRTFLGFFDLQLMEDIKDGKEEVLDEVVMEHIK